MYLMIDNYDSFTYNLVQLFGMLGVEIQVRRNDEIDGDDIDGESADLRGTRAIVISPGPCTPDEAGISLEVVERFVGRRPILGVCLGHQAIARALGGRIRRADRVVHGKTSPIFHDARGLFEGVQNPFEATRYHSLIVDDDGLPTDLTVSARAEDNEIMAVRHRSALCVGVQFHPESVLTEVGSVLMRNFVKQVDAFWAGQWEPPC